jgi:hypothetical protein
MRDETRPPVDQCHNLTGVKIIFRLKRATFVFFLEPGQEHLSLSSLSLSHVASRQIWTSSTKMLSYADKSWTPQNVPFCRLGVVGSCVTLRGYGSEVAHFHGLRDWAVVARGNRVVFEISVSTFKRQLNFIFVFSYYLVVNFNLNC